MQKIFIGVCLLISIQTHSQTKMELCHQDALKGQKYSFLISQTDKDSLIVFVHEDLSKTIINHTAVDFTTGDSIIPVLPADMCIYVPWHKMCSIVYQHYDDHTTRDYILYLEVGVFSEPQCGIITHQGKRFSLRYHYSVIP